jgi:hypothetical protein
MKVDTAATPLVPPVADRKCANHVTNLFYHPPARCVHMNLSVRHFAFIRQEMKEIKDDVSRHSEERHLAAEIMGKVEGEIEWEESLNYNGEPEHIEWAKDEP